MKRYKLKFTFYLYINLKYIFDKIKFKTRLEALCEFHAIVIPN